MRYERIKWYVRRLMDGPVVAVATLLFLSACGGKGAEEPSPRDKAERALYISNEFLNAAHGSLRRAYDSGLCDDQREKCAKATDALVTAQQAVKAARAQLQAWTEGERLPCVIDSLAHVARALRELDLGIPEGFDQAFELLAKFNEQCMVQADLSKSGRLTRWARH